MYIYNKMCSCMNNNNNSPNAEMLKNMEHMKRAMNNTKPKIKASSKKNEKKHKHKHSHKHKHNKKHSL